MASIGNSIAASSAALPPASSHPHAHAGGGNGPLSASARPASVHQHSSSFGLESSSSSDGPFNYAKMLMNYFYRLSQMNEQSWLSIGRMALSLNENEKAKSAFEQAYKNNPNSIAAISNLAQINKQRENYLNAIDLYQKILNTDAQNSDAWSSLAFCFLMQDDIQKAFSAYQQALYFAPNSKDPYLWYGLGILYERHGSDDQAEEFFASALKCDPDFEKAPEIVFRLGVIFKNKKNYSRSMECFEHILRRPPKPLTEPDIRFQMGLLHEIQQNHDYAMQTFNEILSQNPRHIKTIQQLAWGQFNTGNFESALNRISVCIDADNSDSTSWYILGRCHVALCNSNKAYEAYQQAVLRNGKNPVFWCSIGLLYFQIQQYRDALDAFSKAIHINPNLWEVWWNLGILYETCNNQTSDAIDSYKRALDVDTSNALVHQRLKLLKNYQQSSASGPSLPLPVPAPVDLPFSITVSPPWQIFSKRSFPRNMSTSSGSMPQGLAGTSASSLPLGVNTAGSSFGHSSQAVPRSSVSGPSSSFNVRQTPASTVFQSHYPTSGGAGSAANLGRVGTNFSYNSASMPHDAMMRKSFASSGMYSNQGRPHHPSNIASGSGNASLHRYSNQNQSTFNETNQYLNNIRGNLYQNELRSAALQQNSMHKKSPPFYNQSHNSSGTLLTPNISGSMSSTGASPYTGGPPSIGSYNGGCNPEDSSSKVPSITKPLLQRPMSLIDNSLGSGSNGNTPMHQQPLISPQMPRAAVAAGSGEASFIDVSL